MDSDDIFIKSGNALDPYGNVGVFVGSQDGGIIGRAFAICMARGINLVIPIGLEKLIPNPIREALKETGINKMDYSMGMPVGLFPIYGIVVTELEAIEILTGAKAIPIGAGGVDGAEGSITLIIKGDKNQVNKAIKIIEGVKGASL